MMFRSLLSASLLVVLALSLAPQALVCGTVQKHECSCCDDGNSCTCCDIVPVYPDQAAAAASVEPISAPGAWTEVSGISDRLSGHFIPATVPAGPIHGPLLRLQTSQLRI